MFTGGTFPAFSGESLQDLERAIRFGSPVGTSAHHRSDARLDAFEGRLVEARQDEQGN